MKIRHKAIVSYKAGDFTSGKMGEIFKTCHHSLSLAEITHKQFGNANLIPVEYIEFIVTRGLSKNDEFNSFLESDEVKMSVDDFIELESQVKFDIVNEFLHGGFMSWFDVMCSLFLVLSVGCYDKDM